MTSPAPNAAPWRPVASPLAAETAARVLSHRGPLPRALLRDAGHTVAGAVIVDAHGVACLYDSLHLAGRLLAARAS